METVLTPSLVGFAVFVVSGYLLSRIFRRNDVADVLWGLGFLLMTLLHWSSVETPSFRAKLTLALVSLWSLRLSLYLGVRTALKSEDIRYKTWRDGWGPREPVKAFLKVFLLQGFILLIVSLPLSAILHGSQRPLAAFDFLAMGLFLIGFVIESVADWELFIFKRDPKNQGQLLTSGVWSLCRHPNYLGEMLIWWGLGILAIDESFGAWPLASSALMSYLLMKVSGVPMLEKRMKTENPQFQRYMQSTPALFPWRGREISTFFVLIFSLIFLDYLWLGSAMSEFYKNEARHLVRWNGTDWDVLLWPAAGVYFFLALGLQKFALADSWPQSVYRGFLLGLCIYGVYDLTNLSLLNNWPVQMSIVDMAWGPFLCALSAAVGFKFSQWQKRSSEKP